MAATLTSVWGLGVLLGVAVLLIGTIVIGMAVRARHRRQRRAQAQRAGKQFAQEQTLAPSSAPAPSFQPTPSSQQSSSTSSSVRPTLSMRPDFSRERAWEERDLDNFDQQPEDDEWPVEQSPELPVRTAEMPDLSDSGLVQVTVRVQNPSTEPLNHAVLTLAELDGRQVAGVEFGRDGDYDVGPLAPGSYVLVVRCPDYRPYAEIIEVAEGLPSRTRVELSSDSGLTGVVRRKDGEPVSAATVTLKDDHGVVMTARTGPDGDYRVTGVQPGAYTLMVTARVCRPVELAVDVPERGISRQDVELIGGAHVQGTVRVDQGRKVLPGTRILLLDERGEVLSTTDADEQGRYRFSEVNAGEYTVCATPPSPAVSTVRIDGGLVHELDLELRQTS